VGSSRVLLLLLATLPLLAATPKPTRTAEPSYLPDAAASRVVTVTERGTAAAGITVLTEAVAIKETGPGATVARFGEVYAFSPGFVAVHRDEPTEISIWNLQPDDDHDFMLVDPDYNVLMKALLPALRKTTYVFTFHQEGLFTFYCTMHQPEMSGQILVLAPKPG
jgi:plastocyanin